MPDRKNFIRFIILCVALWFNIIEANAQAAHTMRPLSVLINQQEPAWPGLQKLISECKNQVTVLPRDSIRADSALYHAQVTTRSPMGAVVYETGGILIDSGWIRILGSGCTAFDRDLMGWNKGKSYLKTEERPSYLLVADDVIGGFFAINAGAFSKEEMGKIFYMAPDNLNWKSTGLSYTDFLQFCINGDIKKFYAGFQWPGWQHDLRSLSGTVAFSVFPYLFTKEGADITKDTRTAVPIEELWQSEMTYMQTFGKK